MSWREFPGVHNLCKCGLSENSVRKTGTLRMTKGQGVRHVATLGVLILAM
jgi:hypothetical protein